MTGTYQNLILERKPHQFQQTLAPARGKNVGAIKPLPVLNGTAKGGIFVGGLPQGFDLLAGTLMGLP